MLRRVKILDDTLYNTVMANREWTTEEAEAEFKINPEEVFPDLEHWYVEDNVLCIAVIRPDEDDEDAIQASDELLAEIDNYVETLDDDEDDANVIHRFSAI